MISSLFALLLGLVAFGMALWLLHRCVNDMNARLSMLWSLLDEARQQCGPLRWPGLRRAAPYLVAIALIMVAVSASAAAPDIGILDGMVSDYKNAATGWFSPLFGYAQSLFAILATIEVAWAGATWALEKDQLQSWIAALVKKIMTIGFFYALLLNSNTWIPAIINSFVQAGQTAGASGGLSPSNVVSAGLDCALRIMESISNLGFIDAIVVGLVAEICALVIVLSFLWIACGLAVALIESYIAISATVLLLGFGGSRWTTDFVSKVLGYAVATGIKLFVTYLIIGLGMAQANNWANMLATTSVGNNYIYNCLIVVCSAGFFAYLATKIPAMASSMLTGAPTLSTGDAAGTLGGMVAGGIAGGMLATAGGNAVLNAARSGMLGLQAGGSTVLNAARSGIPGLSGGSGPHLAGARAGAVAGGSIQSATAGGLSSTTGSANSITAKTAASLPPSSATPASSAPSSSATQSAAQSQDGSHAGTPQAPQATSPATVAEPVNDAPELVGSVPPPPLPDRSETIAASNGASTPTTGSATSAAVAPAPVITPAVSALVGGTTDKVLGTPAPSAAKSGTSPTTATPAKATENSIGAPSGDSTKPPANEEKKPSMRDELDRLRHAAPNEQAGGGTIHIKLDHGHD